MTSTTTASIIIGILLALAIVLAPWFLPIEYAVTDSATNNPTAAAVENKQASTTDTRPVVTHVPMPDPVKAIYMSSCVVGTPSFRSDLVALIDRTEINAVMIDIKDFSGTLSFPPTNPWWKPAWEAAPCGARDMQAFISDLHSRGIYVIGRITVFQDPFVTDRHPEWAVKRADGTVWKDHKGLSFVEVAAKPYWEKIVDLSVDAYRIGFDELNFDYIRFPSDGNMADARYPLAEAGPWGTNRADNLEAFFVYLHEALTDETRFASVRHTGHGRAMAVPYTSADIFGMTTTNTDDLSIGQVLERTVPYFDAVAPMVYPSHYPFDYLGLGDPNDYPYEIVHHAMTAAVRRLAATTTTVGGFTHTRIGTTTPARYTKSAYPPTRLRTWIQDFDYGGEYDAADVRAQITASQAAGVASFMLWAPSNRYTESALTPE